LFSPDFSTHIRQAAHTYAETARCHPISFAAFRQNPWYLRGSLALEQTQLNMRFPYLDNDFVRTVFRAPASALSGNGISFRLIADGNQKLLGIPTDRGVVANRGSLYAKASHLAKEFSFKAEYAYDMGMPQWLARLDHALAPLQFERAFLGRHKPFHFRIWYRDALAPYIQDVLLDERSLSRPHINRKGLETIVRGHTRGDGNYTYDIHKALTLELVYRLLIEKPSNRGSDVRRASDVCFA
jgi:asparagine synthase (glutamine-hydrolysing)